MLRGEAVHLIATGSTTRASRLWDTSRRWAVLADADVTVFGAAPDSADLIDQALLTHGTSPVQATDTTSRVQILPSSLEPPTFWRSAAVSCGRKLSQLFQAEPVRAARLAKPQTQGSTSVALPTIASAPSDFDFVIGDWHVRHRRLNERLANCREWTEFEGTMSTRKILGGYGNLEDNWLNFPDGAFRAVALRSFDPATETWAIWWLDGRFPGRLDVPVKGQFKDGVGTFYADDAIAGVAIKVRFLWSCSDAMTLRWEQAFSTDGGLTWETNWTMDFTRKPSV